MNTCWSCGKRGTRWPNGKVSCDSCQVEWCNDPDLAGRIMADREWKQNRLLSAFQIKEFMDLSLPGALIVP